MAILDDISEAVQRGKRKDVKKLVQQALDEGIDAGEILDKGLLAAMDVIGPKFRDGEMFVPEVLVAARALNAGSEVLKPVLAAEGTEPLGKAVIGTVKDDMHDIGKNLVRMMIEGKGIEVEDLGIDVKTESFVDYVKEHPDTDLVCLSALLTTTMPHLKEVIDAFKDAGLRDSVIIMVGGAPVTQEYADEIGADAYTPDAGSCAIKAAELLKAKKGIA
jgi:5-methyltetrahydrofolate--homocysteine methyltransferase